MRACVCSTRLADVVERRFVRVELVEGHSVVARGGERKVVAQDAGAVDVGHGGDQRAPVLVVGDAPAVVALGSQVVERRQRRLRETEARAGRVA
eukprot:216285-Pleurochrysis_carterae.AAC.1